MWHLACGLAMDNVQFEGGWSKRQWVVTYLSTYDSIYRLIIKWNAIGFARLRSDLGQPLLLQDLPHTVVRLDSNDLVLLWTLSKDLSELATASRQIEDLSVLLARHTALLQQLLGRCRRIRRSVLVIVGSIRKPLGSPLVNPAML